LLTTRDDRDVHITGGEAIGKNKKTDRNTVGVKDLELKGSKDVKGADLPTAVEYEVISVAAASPSSPGDTAAARARPSARRRHRWRTGPARPPRR